MEQQQQVNIPLLRKAVEWAEAEAAKPPELGQWYQVDTVVHADGAVDLLGKSPECGTCYCIAGYVAMLQTGFEDPYDSPEIGASGTVCGYAAEQLGIGESHNALFAMDNSIADVRRIAEELAGERL